LIVDLKAAVFACDGGVAPRLNIHTAIALCIDAVHGNAACGFDVVGHQVQVTFDLQARCGAARRLHPGAVQG
jgi:hypothetical protein